MADEKRSWPNDNHYHVLMTGTLDQLDTLYAFLPSVQTEEQGYFIRKLVEKIRELRVVNA